jgi:tRNA threonylcarbamoyl adenosine modification protein YeaZ
MKPFLLIETSTDRGLVALGTSKQILFQRELPAGANQSKFLMPCLKDALEFFGENAVLEAIGVGIGPGSYTGIRVGVAAAQALAYSWRLPLIGFSSLDGFIPTVPVERFASVIDARIAGTFVQKGAGGQGEVWLPQVCPLDQLGALLEGIEYLVTPHAGSLQRKLQPFYPAGRWNFEETGPSASALFKVLESKVEKGEGAFPPERLNLLYLLQTEAEREQLKRKNSTIS